MQNVITRALIFYMSDFLSFQVYKNMYGAMVQGAGAMGRPEWWQEWQDKPDPGSRSQQKAKL